MYNINNFQNNIFQRQSLIRKPVDADDTPAKKEVETDAPTISSDSTFNVVSESANNKQSLASTLDTIAAANKLQITFTPGNVSNIDTTKTTAGEIKQVVKTTADPVQATIDKLKAMGITVDADNAKLLNCKSSILPFTEDPTTGVITLKGLDGSHDTGNASQAVPFSFSVDDGVVGLKLDNCSNVVVSANTKTKLTSSGKLQNIIVYPRCDIDYNEKDAIKNSLEPTENPNFKIAQGVYLAYNTSGAAADPATCTAEIWASGKPGDLNSYPTGIFGHTAPLSNFKGFDTTIQVNNRISQLETMIGKSISAEDKALLANSLLDKVVVTKDAQTGKINVTKSDSPYAFSNDVVTVQALIAKYANQITTPTTNPNSIANAQKAVDDARAKATAAATAATAAGIAAAKAQVAVTTAKSNVDSTTNSANQAAAAKAKADATLATVKASSDASVQSATAAVTNATTNLTNAKAALAKAKGIFTKIFARLAVLIAESALKTANSKLTTAKATSAVNIAKAQAPATAASTKATTTAAAANAAKEALSKAQTNANNASENASTTSAAATKAAADLAKAEAALAALKA